LVDVIDVEAPSAPERPRIEADAHPLLREMEANLAELALSRVAEVYHDAVFAKERARELFDSGVLTLRELAQVDQLYLVSLDRVHRLVAAEPGFEEIRLHTERSLVDRYFCNFSVFQSLPDSWAIEQIFPVMPIHRLTERPDRSGTLHDITCDSDGAIARFPGLPRETGSLPLHSRANGERYILGIFLTGAYQEILGDLHNLFGDTNAVHVRIDNGDYQVTSLVRGDTVTEVLNYVQYRADDLLANFRRKAAAALAPADAAAVVAEYAAGLAGNTYLAGGRGRSEG